MVSPPDPKSILLLFSTCFLFSPSLSQIFGNCPMITVSDLGSTADVSSEGLAAGIVGLPIQIQESTTLCVSSGTLRSTYQSASVLIRYQCPNCTNEINVHQFTFICDYNRWTGNPVSSINHDPQASFNMETDTHCLFCSPSLGSSTTQCIG